MCRLRHARGCLRRSCCWPAFAFLLGRPSIRGCSAYGLVLRLPRRCSLPLLLFCTCPPLCAGALWPVPAWVWRDVRIFFLLHVCIHVNALIADSGVQACLWTGDCPREGCADKCIINTQLTQSWDVLLDRSIGEESYAACPLLAHFINLALTTPGLRRRLLSNTVRCPCLPPACDSDATGACNVSAASAPAIRHASSACGVTACIAQWYVRPDVQLSSERCPDARV